MTEKKMDYLKKREDKILLTMQHKDIEQGRRALENKHRLDAMVLDSRHWPKLNDLENSITTHMIMPQTIMNHQDYQHKL